VTGTTPILGKRQHPKDIVAIMEAHAVPYVATANASYPLDLYQKVSKAMSMVGLRFIHVYSPCPPGWGFLFSDTIRIGELAVQTGWNVLYEVENGVFHLTAGSESVARKGNPTHVREFLTAQGRFSNVTEETVQELQDWVTARWQRYLERARSS
jgi:pyruvate ferredoxin oxidoreductase beta subunit